MITRGGDVRDGYVWKQLEVCLDGCWETLWTDESPVSSEAQGLPSEWLDSVFSTQPVRG